MKYTALEPKRETEYRIENFGGGINSRGAGIKPDDTVLKDSSNMWFKDGCLRTRPGLSSDYDKIIETESHCHFCDKSFCITDTEFFDGISSKKVGYFIGEDGYSYCKVYVYLADGEKNIESIGNIKFSNMGGGNFYIPENVFFVVGEANRGCGLYAFIMAASYEKRLYTIYELAEDKSNWIMITPDNYYCPVIYMNGRGSSYETALGAGGAYEAEPQMPEQLNMLTGAFQAYFTSDGYSPAFQLPITELDEMPVNCRVYITPDNYTEWIIPAESDSATANFFSVPITVKCDRSRGIITFYTGEEECPVPKMSISSNNNICIYAYKTVPDGEARIISSKGAFRHNSRFFLYGNDKRKNEVYSARVSNPLYFPKNAKVDVGDSSGPVTAIAQQRGKLIAFKNNEIYKINVTDGKDYLSKEVLIRKSGDMLGADTLEAQLICADVGCGAEETVVLCGNRLVWLGTDKKVYALATTTYGKENNVYEISSPISQALTEALKKGNPKIFAFIADGHYFLVIGKTVFLTNYKTRGFGYISTYVNAISMQNVAWYRWEFPENTQMLCGFESDGAICAVCSNRDGMINFLCEFSGKKDCYFYESSGSVEKAEDSIFSFLETHSLNFRAEHLRKKITELYIELSGGRDIFFSINGSSQRRISAASENELLYTGILPMVRNCQKAEFKLSSGEPFAVGSTVFIYVNEAK